VIAIDTETVSLKDRTLLGVGIAVSPSDAFYVSVGDPSFQEVIILLQNPYVVKVLHNALYDIRVLRPWGIDVTLVEDTAIMTRLIGLGGVLEEASFYVKTTARSAGDVIDSHGVSTMAELPDSVIAEKCCEDTLATFQLYEKFKDEVPQKVYQLDRRVIPLLEKVSSKGIRIDQDRLEHIRKYYQREYSYYTAVADGIGFNPSKSFEVGYILSEMGEFLPLTKKGRLSTDENVLRGVRSPKAIPIAQLTLLFRRAQKMLGTYLLPLKDQDRAFTMLHMNAVTGRINGTSAGSNNLDRGLLNLPKRADLGKPEDLKYRGVFIPNGTRLTEADANQIELRVLAHLSGDKRMQWVFANDGDLHSDAEMAIWGSRGTRRDFAKVFNYSVAYNADVQAIADGIESTDLVRVAAERRKWLDTYTGAASWMNSQMIEGPRQGYVESALGRKMWLPTDREEKHVLNCSINWPIQTFAAEIFKMCILECEYLVDWALLYIHDAQLYEGKVPIPDLSSVSEVHVPWESKVGDRWS